MALGVGVLGCGRIGAGVHLGALARMRGVEVRALAEPDPERRRDAARLAPAARPFEAWQDLLAHAELDAVVIALPTALHAEAAVAALGAGRHVYLEKPVAATLACGRRVLAAWRGPQQVAMVGFNYRFHPLHRAARDYLRSGRLGRARAMRSVFSTAEGPPLPVWKQRREGGGGVLLDLGSHHVDLAEFLFGGPVREVVARTRSARADGEAAELEMRIGDGIEVRSAFAWGEGEADRFEIEGERGTLRVDRHRSVSLEIEDPRGRRRWRSPSWIRLKDRLLAPRREPSYALALEHFAACARAGRAAEPDLRAGLRSLAVVVAAEESARSGRPVVPARDVDEDPARP
jgi:predicted dehydrogenase